MKIIRYDRVLVTLNWILSLHLSLEQVGDHPRESSALFVHFEDRRWFLELDPRVKRAIVSITMNRIWDR